MWTTRRWPLVETRATDDPRADYLQRGDGMNARQATLLSVGDSNVRHTWTETSLATVQNPMRLWGCQPFGYRTTDQRMRAGNLGYVQGE